MSRDSIASLFQHSAWPTYQDALTHRYDARMKDLLSFVPEPGLDAASSLASIMATLRELALLREIRDQLPTALTLREQELQLQDSLENRDAESEEEAPRLAGEDRFVDDPEEEDRSGPPG